MIKIIFWRGFLEDKKTSKNHTVTLDNRKAGMLTGILDVFAFDEEVVLLMTENGKLQIKGEQLHVNNLNLETGEMEIEGKINSLVYLTKKVKKKGESFLKQFFR